MTKQCIVSVPHKDISALKQTLETVLAETPNRAELLAAGRLLEKLDRFIKKEEEK